MEFTGAGRRRPHRAVLAIAIAAVLTVGVGMAGAFTRGPHPLDCADYSWIEACQDAFDQSTAPPHAEISPGAAIVDTATTFTGGLAPGPGQDKTITGYSWDFGHGDTMGNAHPVRTFTTTGRQDVKLTLTLADGTTVQTAETLHVGDPAPLRMQLFTDEQAAPGQAPYMGAFAFDPDDRGARDATYDWDFGDGSPVLHTTEETPEHAYAADGDYEVTVTAHLDGKTASRSSWVAVDDNPAPGGCRDATGGEDVEVGTPWEIDCSGNLADAQVDFGDGTSATVTPTDDFSATHTYGTARAYEVTVTLHPAGGGAAVERKLWVNVVPAAPRSVSATYFMPDTGRPHVGAAVTLWADATGFADDATYTWSFDDGTPDDALPDSGGLDHIYASPGMHEATVTAHDGNGPDATDSVWIAVDPAGIPRVVGLGVPDEVDAGQETGFLAGIFDEDGVTGQEAYQWSFDGVVDPAQTAAFASHTFTSPGSHSAKVVVSEPNRPTVQREKTFTVAGTAPPAAGGGGGGGTPPAGSPAPAPAPALVPVIAPAPAKPAVSGTLPRRGSLKKGIKLGVRCSTACTLKATVTLPKSLAKRFKLTGALAKGRLHLTKAGKGTIKLKATKAARKLLRKLKGKTVTLTVTGGAKTLHRQVKLTG